MSTEIDIRIDGLGAQSALSVISDRIERLLGSLRNSLLVKNSAKTARPRKRQRFNAAVKRVNSSDFYNSACDAAAPYGYYDGRHIIGEANPIQGGVYLGVIAHEALVVDEKHGQLAELYRQFVLRYVRNGVKPADLEKKVLSHAVELVISKIDLDPIGVRQLAYKHKIAPDRKTALDFYIKEGIGAARHQVLLAGYIVQTLIARNLIGGTVRIEPRYAELPAEDEKLIYTNSLGVSYLFDPVNAVFGAAEI